MAIVNGYMPFQMWNVATYYGEVLYSDANEITISNGTQTSVYTGDFTYDYYGNVYGTMTGYTEFYNGQTVVEISDFQVNANVAYNAILAGNSDALIELVAAGEDWVFGSAYGDKIAGYSGDDVLLGYGGNDTIYGGTGDDYLVGGQGADYLNGGAGLDFASYYTATSGVKVDLARLGKNLGDAKGDVYQSIEVFSGSKYKDKLLGDSSDNMFFGSGGKDRLVGRGGDDSLWGDQGRDVLIGGAGQDWLDGGAGNDRLVGGRGNDVMSGGKGYDTFVFKRGDGHDTITDFNLAMDMIRIGKGASDMSDLNIYQVGADAIVDFANVSIRLEGIDARDLDANDFNF